MPSSVLALRPLGFPWETADPFLFCVHHDDHYPAGNEHLGPAESLEGRTLGNDFEPQNGWRMYHGRTVPGFPQHPHRGFETLTVVRQGFIDHSDSLGATARYGPGDVQWLTAGAGIVHAEMFPLLHRDRPNPAELFQLWLNLPREDKLCPPHFSMLWREAIPRLTLDGGAEVTVVAGALAGAVPPAPPPRSWASRPEADLAVWLLRLPEGSLATLPPAAGEGTVRTLYFYRGPALTVGDHPLHEPLAARVRADQAVTLEAPEGDAEVLVLQGRPLREPVAQHGPFVMNTRQELQQAFLDYQRTRFGVWPFPDDAPVHGPSTGSSPGRFARHADGRTERPEG
ncbi:MAG: pirin family protein [Deltaproteobacteria bacterium]|nr:pirin family protein [Deltaproteobacteria bacterium]